MHEMSDPGLTESQSVSLAGLKAVRGYENNPLIQACGPVLDYDQLVKRLRFLPPRPKHDSSVPSALAAHAVAEIWQLRVPHEVGISLAMQMDVMRRWGYVHRCQTPQATARYLHGQFDPSAMGPPHVQLAAALGGAPGSGKSKALDQFRRLGPIVVVHEHFAGLQTPVKQLMALHVDMPESGRLNDLVDEMARFADQALGTDNLRELGSQREASTSRAGRLLDLLRKHFVGIIVIDEIQNLFNLSTKRSRELARSKHWERPELRVVDDAAVKFILTLFNRSQIPLVVSGSPDGMRALSSRVSTLQRLSTGGYFHIPCPQSSADGHFQVLLNGLLHYQWTQDRIKPSGALSDLVFQLSAGINRIIISLWFHAQQRAIWNGQPAMTLDDLRAVAAGPMADLQPAVQALLSDDPDRMSRYEDLLRETELWG